MLQRPLQSAFAIVAEWAELRPNLSAVNARLVKFVQCRLMQVNKVHRQTQQGKKQNADDIYGDAMLCCRLDVAVLQFSVTIILGTLKCGLTNSLRPNQIMIAFIRNKSITLLICFL